jgi:hypothetical protein
MRKFLATAALATAVLFVTNTQVLAQSTSLRAAADQVPTTVPVSDLPEPAPTPETRAAPKQPRITDQTLELRDINPRECEQQHGRPAGRDRYEGCFIPVSPNQADRDVQPEVSSSEPPQAELSADGQRIVNQMRGHHMPTMVLYRNFPQPSQVVYLALKQESGGNSDVAMLKFYMLMQYSYGKCHTNAFMPAPTRDQYMNPYGSRTSYTSNQYFNWKHGSFSAQTGNWDVGRAEQFDAYQGAQMSHDVLQNFCNGANGARGFRDGYRDLFGAESW